MATRKEVKKALASVECYTPFSLRTVSFADLARDSAQFCIFKEIISENWDAIESVLKDVGVIPQFKSVIG